MVDTTGAERGAFNEDEARAADRATPSVAEAGGASGNKPIWMWVAMAAGVALTIWLVVIIPMQNQAAPPTVVDAAPVEVDRSQRAVDRTFPGTGFDLAPADEAAPAPVADDTTQRERALMLQIESLELQLQQAREESAQQARATALRLQIEAAQRAEAERVSRLRSDVLIEDFSSDDTTETGPRDLPNEAAPAEEEAGEVDAPLGVESGTDASTLGLSDDGLDPTETVDAVSDAATGQAGTIPPALIELMGAQGLGAAPEGQE